MHFSFIPYGKRSEVELLFRDMEAQKHLLKMTKGKEERSIWIQGQLRQMPLGVYEYVFPKEDLATVLQTLVRGNKYDISPLILTFLKKFYKLSKIPEYKKDKNYLWIQDRIIIIPLGVRYDDEFTDPDGNYKGWTHEAI